MANLKSKVWWRAAGMRALRTALVIATPYVPIVVQSNDWALLAGVASFGALTSLLTSLAGIAEADGMEVPWFWAILERVVKTAAQALITAFGSATMFSQVDWSTIPALTITAVLGSLFLAVLKQLPESETLERATTSKQE